MSIDTEPACQLEIPTFQSRDTGVTLWWRAVEQAYTMPMAHCHDDFELYYLFNGHRGYLIRDQLWEVGPGSLVFIPPGVLHQTTRTFDFPHERIVIHCRPEAFGFGPVESEPIFHTLFALDSPVWSLDGALRSEIETRLRHILGEAVRGHALSETVVKFEFGLLLVRLAMLRAGSSLEMASLPN